MRSTIMTFSARSLSLARSSSASRASVAASPARGRVPLIGRVLTAPPGSTSRNRSGDALSRLTPPIRIRPP